MAVYTYNLNTTPKKQLSYHFSLNEFASPDSGRLKLDAILPFYLEAIIYFTNQNMLCS